jgi:DNA-binding LacI/PurR family transcriptional regulator
MMQQPVLGVITNNQHQVFQQNVIAGTHEIAAQHGYAVQVVSYAEDPAHPEPITLDYRAMAGVLVIADACPIDLLREMYEAGTPLSLVSHQVPELLVPSVITDNIQGIAELVKHLVERCCRRKLVYIRGIPTQRDSMERETAFFRELMRYNIALPDAHFLRGDFSAPVAAQSVQRLIDSGADFDAIIAADYVMGIAAVDTLRKNDLHVPGDVSVVGFGDAPEAEAAELTTVAADVVEQGRRAARQLISQYQGMRITGVTVLSVRLMVRETCGCIRLHKL